VHEIDKDGSIVRLTDINQPTNIESHVGVAEDVLVSKLYSYTWQHSVVVSALASIIVDNRHWARLVLGWVTDCGWVNHLSM